MRRWMFFTQADCVTIGTQVMREVRMFDEKLLNKAEALYIRCRLDEAFPLFMELAGAGCGRASITITVSARLKTGMKRRPATGTGKARRSANCCPS